VIPHEWLQRRVTIEQAEADNSRPHDDGEYLPQPFGWLKMTWHKMIKQMQDGDELWEFNSPPKTWENLCGRKGYAILRKGEVVDSLITLMNYAPNHRLQLTGCARDMMWLSVWSLLSAGGRQLSLFR